MRTIVLLLVALCCCCSLANAQEEGYTKPYPPLFQVFDSPLPPMRAIELMQLGCTATAKDPDDKADCVAQVKLLSWWTNAMMSKVISLAFTWKPSRAQVRRRQAAIDRDYAHVKRVRVELDKRHPLVRNFLFLRLQEEQAI